MKDQWTRCSRREQHVKEGRTCCGSTLGLLGRHSMSILPGRPLGVREDRKAEMAIAAPASPAASINALPSPFSSVSPANSSLSSSSPLA